MAPSIEPRTIEPRSYLYVPGDRIDRVPKAVAAGADALILDLDDGVPPAAKDDARAAVAEAVATAPADEVPRWVRVSAGATMAADLHALFAATGGAAGLTGLVVAKATVASVKAALEAGAPRVCPLVETAAAYVALADLAALDGVSHLALGETDLAADLGMDPGPDGVELLPLRVQTVVVSAAAGLAAPTGPVTVDLRDLDRLRTSTDALRRLGYGARSCIHPTQVAVVNEVFTPSSDELDRAAAIVALFDGNGGGPCIGPDGRMLDEAVVRSARRTLARARS